MKTRACIQEIINSVLDQFEPGYKVKQRLLQEINTKHPDRNSILSSNYAYLGYPHAFQNQFKSYDANTISGTTYIAAGGPQTANDVVNFIKTFIDNPSYPAIKQVIALGSCLANGSGIYQDYFDYCIQPKTQYYAHYKITLINQTGEFNIPLSELQISPFSYMTSTLAIETENETHTLTVHILPLARSEILLLNEENDKPNTNPLTAQKPTRETLWQLFKLTHDQPTLIHCSSGIDRTGHLILLFEVLKEYRRIFSQNHISACAERILTIIQRIRKYRPCLIMTNEQLQAAITNADELYRYAIKKNYDINQHLLPKTVALADENPIPSPSNLPLNFTFFETKQIKETYHAESKTVEPRI